MVDTKTRGMVTTLGTVEGAILPLGYADSAPPHPPDSRRSHQIVDPRLGYSSVLGCIYRAWVAVTRGAYILAWCASSVLRGIYVPGDSNILLRVDSATKAEWKRCAALEGLSLTRLIFSSVEARLGVGKDPGVGAGIPVTGTPPGAVAAAAHQAPSEPQLGAATTHPVVSAEPLPVPAPKAEPASKPPKKPERVKSWRDPVVVGLPQRRHHPRCDCASCKG